MVDLKIEPFQERGYKPIVGGVRHLTRHRSSPLPGMAVELLCGDYYQVSLSKQNFSKSDCLTCYQVRMRQVNNGH